MGDRSMVAMAARLIHSAGQAGVGPHLLRGAEACHLAQFGDNHQCRENADAVDVQQGFYLRKIFACLLELFIKDGHVLGIISQLCQQLIANEILDRSEILFVELGQTAWAERDLVGCCAILTGQ